MKKKIIIIGGGLAGLSAGCYSQMNGFDTEIFEMHNLPGGMCTSWKRGEYTFDGCISWLMGANPTSQFYKAMAEVGALRDKEFLQHEIVAEVEGENGRKVTFYSDVDKLETELLTLSPGDEKPIRELTNSIRRMSKLKMPMDKPQDMFGFSDTVKMLPMMLPMIGIMRKFGSCSIVEYSKRFQDPLLVQAFQVLLPKEYSAFVLVMMLSTYNSKDASWPIGGSLEFSKGIEKNYLELGGKIHYNSRVEKILVKDDTVSGVLLSDDSVYPSDYVISSADGYSTIFNMLEGKYIDNSIRRLYTETPTAPTSVQVSLGIDCDLSDESHFILSKLEEPFMVGNIAHSHFLFRHFCYDKTLAPKGKSVVITNLETNYDFWEKLYNDKSAYKAEKDRISKRYVEAFEKRFPYAKGKVEAVDVSTPMTYKRYTDAWKGIYMGWMSTPSNLNNKVPSVLPGLKNFYMAGQFTAVSGGIPTALMTGRWSIMKICACEKKDFQASIG